MNNLNEISTNNIDKRNQFIDMVFLNNIKFNISLKNQYTECFYTYITKMIQYMMNANNNVFQNSQLLELLQKFQSIFALLESTSAMLAELNNKVAILKNSQDINLQNFNDFPLNYYASQSFNDFVQEYYSTIEEINKNNLEFEKFMFYCATSVEFNFNNTNIDNPIQATSNTDNLTSSKNQFKADNIEIYTDTVNNRLENTLIISESTGKVILPYTLQDLNDILKTSDNDFSNIQEIIDKKFTIPYANYSNPIISRFKEAYNLAKNKEKRSIIQSFNLGMELLFNYNLHPAIISACKNLNELDIYLDYLESGEVDKFKIFDIIFDVAPAVIK